MILEPVGRVGQTENERSINEGPVVFVTSNTVTKMC